MCACLPLGVCMRALTACANEDACISVHVRGLSCLRMHPFRYVRRSDVAFSPEKKAAHCPHDVRGLKSGLVWSGLRLGRHGWSSVSLHAEARPCSQVFVQLAHQRGHQGLKPPHTRSGPVGHLHRRTHPGQQPPDPLTRGLFAPRPSFKEGAFCSALIWSSVSAQAFVISAIDLLQMS